MIDTSKSAKEALLETHKARSRIGIARVCSITPELGKAQLRELHRFDQFFGSVFKIDSQLLACVDAIVRISGDLLPKHCSARMFTAPFGHLRQLAMRPGAILRREAEVESLCARRRSLG